MNRSSTIQIILVLYKTTLKDCLSYQSLKQYLPKTSINYELILFNNYSEITIENEQNCTVINSKTNLMLTGAYNYALNIALESGKKWLLLLDQDTLLTEKYFN